VAEALVEAYTKFRLPPDTVNSPCTGMPQCAADVFYLAHQRRQIAALMVSPIQAFAKTDGP